MNKDKFHGRRERFWAGGFLYDPQTSRVLLHLRDGNTPYNPHQWSFFGGSNEDGETFGECFIREMKEEIGLTIPPEGAVYLRDYFRTDESLHRAVFYAESSIPTEQLILGEGAGFRWFAWDELPHYDLTAYTRKDLNYFRTRPKRETPFY